MPRVLALSGSPSPTSRSAVLVDWICDRIRSAGVTVDHVRLASLDCEPFVRGRIDAPEVLALGDQVRSAHGIILGTPIYKAAYSGLLKVVLDVLPQFAFAGKVVLPVATGGSPAHILALDYGLRPVIQSMAARHVVQSAFVAEPEMDLESGTLRASADLLVTHALRNFLHSLSDAEEAALLGHPRPETELPVQQ